MDQAKKTSLSKIALFAASIIWGGSFSITKATMEVFPPNLLVAIRFTIGCILLSIIFHKRLKKIDKHYLLSGAILGSLLFLAFFAQTAGLKTTTPGKNAFLTTVYCVIVPFLFWAVTRQRPDAYNVVAAIICIAGIGFVSLNGAFSIQKGDALTLLGGFFFACHIVAVAVLTRKKDPVLLTLIQFGTAAVLAWVVSLCRETFSLSWVTPQSIWGLIFLAVVSTTFCLLLQSVGQKYTPASTAAIILSLEAVFGILFSVLFFGEQLTWRLVLGFALIFLAVVTSVTKFSFLKKHRKTKKQHRKSMEP